MSKTNLNTPEWAIIRKLAMMNIKRIESNLLDTKSKVYNSEEKQKNKIEEIEADIAKHQLLLMKAEINLSNQPLLH